MSRVDEFNLTAELQAFAFEEFGETIDSRTKGLFDLRQLIANLPEKDRIIDISDKNLLRFLRARKYDLDATLKSVIQYHHFMSSHESILSNIQRNEITDFSDFLTVVREPGPRGKLIVIMRPALGIPLFTIELLKANPRVMFRYNFWLFERISHDPYAQICGLILINSFKGLGFWGQMKMSSMAPISDQFATF